jgi:quercetin dioxygenase-like cupin family protein
MHFQALAITLLLAGLASCTGEPPSTIVRELAAAETTASGQAIRLPTENARVVLSTYVIPPGAKLPRHRHPHPRIALVDRGSISVTNVDTNHTVRYGPGDMIVESIGQWHFGETVGHSEVHLRVLDLLPAGVTSNVILKE